MSITVFHCDDSPAVTRLTRFWLGEHPDLEYVGAAHSHEHAVAALAACDPDVVLLDTLGAPGDPRLLGAVRRAAPRARVIVYSGYVGLLAPEAFAAGADAHLAKGDDEHELVGLIRRLGHDRDAHANR